MSDDDVSFDELFPGVTPLTGANKASQRVSLAAGSNTGDQARFQIRREGAETFQVPPDDSQSMLPAEAEMGLSCLSYRMPGIQLKRFKRLKTGKLPVQDRLDLHGMTVPQATRTLDAFIASAQDQGLSQVLIIHGKGHHNPSNEAVLKTHTANYLLQLPAVLAYHSALQKDGGLGALYVLLRKVVA
ncbi:MAG: Smr/MutS family protein [Pseudomonadota bacterium]